MTRQPDSAQHIAPAEFLAGSELSGRIRQILQGRDLRLAVAFWGEGAARELIQGHGPVQILCDVSMGGTNPKALIELDALEAVTLKHIVGLHAKVYISSAGLVLGSPNASHGGIGFSGSDPGNLEAGTFHTVNSDAWSAAFSWFKTHFGSAEDVGPDEIEWAWRSWRRPPPRLRPSRGSLLDMIRLAPDRYRGLAFFFEKIPLGERTATEVKEESQLSAVAPEDVSTIVGCSHHDMFTGLSTEEVTEAPQLFLEFWKPKNASLRIYARQVVYRDLTNGVLYTKKSARQLWRAWPGLLPKLQEANKADDEAVGRLLARQRGGIRFMGPEGVIKALAKAS